MVEYRPVLPARAGELAALADLAPSVWACLTPVLQLVPGDRHTVGDQCRTVRDRVADSWQPGMRLALDGGGVEADDSLVHGGDVLVELWTEVRSACAEVTPVVGLADRRTIPSLRSAGALDRGLVLRLRPVDLALPHETLDLAVTALLALAGLDRAAVDLVTDLAAEPAVPDSVGPVLSDRTWRSRTLLCGAFPADMTGTPVMELREIPRRDVRTWRAVGTALGPAGRDLDFGTHPEFARGLGRADAQIEARARQGPRSGLGCGGPSTWRELSTAHHLEYVVREIRSAP